MRSRVGPSAALGLFAVLGGAAAGDQPVDAPPGPTLIVRGDVETPLRLTPADLAEMPRRSVEAADRDGREARFEGVAVGEVLGRAGARLGDRLRGEALASYLLVEAADGYRVVFALPELDEASSDRLVLLADHKDGRPLEDPEGPFRLVVPDEKRHARWVRQVRALTIRRVGVDPPPPRGPSSR